MSLMGYRLTCDGEERIVASQGVIESCFEQIRKRGGGELWVSKLAGEMRSLGSVPRLRVRQ